MDSMKIYYLASLVTNVVVMALQEVRDSQPHTAQEACYCLRLVAEHLHSPVAAIFYKEHGQVRTLVVEQRGVVVKLGSDGTRLETFMDIRDRVMTSEKYGENRGLLSLVMDPNYDIKKKVYAYYIRKVDGRDYAYVSAFSVEDGQVNPKTEVYLLRMYQPFERGNGGPMLFGDDGYLYIVTGDGGEKDDPTGNAQNKNSFYGKVLRIDVDGGQDFTEGDSGIAKLYGIPGSNPFVNESIARPELFALGFRNMWGCSQDSTSRRGGSGRIFCAETGTNKFDEINVIQSGMNYGWNIRQGTACHMTNPAECGPIENEKFPIYEFPHNASHALVGGFVYRGEIFSGTGLSGVYTFGDVITGKTYLLEEARPDEWVRREWSPCEHSTCPPDAKGTPLKHILAFGQDLKGELYLLMTKEFLVKSSTGALFELVPPRRDITRDFNTKLPPLKISQ